MKTIHTLNANLLVNSNLLFTPTWNVFVYVLNNKCVGDRSFFL